MITAGKFAEIKGKHYSWGTRLAQKARAANYPYPKKIGRYWLATLEEWELVLKHTGLQIRNRETYRKEDDSE